LIGATRLDRLQCLFHCGRFFSFGDDMEYLVACLGYSWGGRFYPASTHPWKRYKQPPKPVARHPKTHEPLPPSKAEYCNEIAESVSKKPEVKLAPIKDRKHAQEWRNSPVWFENQDQ